MREAKIAVMPGLHSTGPAYFDPIGSRNRFNVNSMFTDCRFRQLSTSG
jgi:hypothetical protein